MEQMKTMGLPNWTALCLHLWEHLLSKVNLTCFFTLETWQADTCHVTPRNCVWRNVFCQKSFPGGSVVKNPSANAGDPGSIPELGRPPGEGNGNPLQYSSLENPMEGGLWRAAAHGVAESQRPSD